MKKRFFTILSSFFVLSLASCGEPKISTSDIVEQLQDANFPIEEITNYTEENDPNELLGKPGQYIEKINFSDFNFPCSGFGLDGISIEIFDNEEDCDNRKEYVEKVAKEYGYTEYYYQDKNILLRLNGDIPSKYASQYSSAVQNVISGKKIDKYNIAQEYTSTLTVELSSNITDSESSSIKTSLESMPEIMSIEYIEGEERFEKFSDIYLDGDEELADSFESDFLNNCYSVVVSNWNVDELSAEIESFEGVGNVSAIQNVEDPKID